MRVPIQIANYHMVVLKCPKEGTGQVGGFQAPPGFRLHSITQIKETLLVGEPAKFMAVFEQILVGETDNGQPAEEKRPVGDAANDEDH